MLDVTITGIDLERSAAIEGGPKSRQLALRLSHTASQGWCDDFNAAWREKMYMTKCAATADGAEILIGCYPEALEHHLPQIQTVVRNVNEDRQSRLVAAKARLERSEQRDADRNGNLRKLNERLFS